MKKQKLTATLPDGAIATRTTHRTYTHVIAGRLADHPNFEGNGDWVVLGWAGRRELAEKRLDAEKGAFTSRWYDKFEMVEVDN